MKASLSPPEYEEAVKTFKPYDKVKEVNEEDSNPNCESIRQCFNDLNLFDLVPIASRSHLPASVNETMEGQYGQKSFPA